MNYKSFPIGIHINENSVKMLDGIVRNDNGNLFQVQLYSGTQAYDFTGYSLINATIVRPDETTISDVWTASETDEGVTTEGSHTFLAIQQLDPANGRITLKVGGMATAQVGLHRMALEIYDADARVTTARINYHVAETLDNIDQTLLDQDDDYTALQSLLAECANMISAERERSNQEAQRQEMAAELQDTLERAIALFDQALAEGQLEALQTYLVNYIDTNYGEAIQYAPYTASATAPEETRTLWIDTASGNLIKYYNGDEWVATSAVAIFG